MSTAKQRHWREICEELLQEKHTDKVETLLQELAQALDRPAGDREETRPQPPQALGRGSDKPGSTQPS